MVSTYEKHFSALQENPDSALPGVEGANAEDVKGKETSNLIVLLSELYNFQVISCLLVYDIIRMLLEGNLTEFKVELLLKITRSMSSLSCMIEMTLTLAHLRLRTAAENGRPLCAQGYHSVGSLETAK